MLRRHAVHTCRRCLCRTHEWIHWWVGFTLLSRIQTILIFSQQEVMRAGKRAKPLQSLTHLFLNARALVSVHIQIPSIILDNLSQELQAFAHLNRQLHLVVIGPDIWCGRGDLWMPSPTPANFTFWVRLGEQMVTNNDAPGSLAIRMRLLLFESGL